MKKVLFKILLGLAKGKKQVDKREQLRKETGIEQNKEFKS